MRKPAAALIEFESGWDAKRRNHSSSATGLIQFMDKTAWEMGFRAEPGDERYGTGPKWAGASAALVRLYPTVEEQLLGPVLDYLYPYKPFIEKPGTLPGQSLFLAVFYPMARYWHPDRSFPEKVQRANPGINCPRDYVRHVWRRAGEITDAELAPDEETQ